MKTMMNSDYPRFLMAPAGEGGGGEGGEGGSGGEGEGGEGEEGDKGLLAGTGKPAEEGGEGEGGEGEGGGEGGKETAEEKAAREKAEAEAAAKLNPHGAPDKFLLKGGKDKGKVNEETLVKGYLELEKKLTEKGKVAPDEYTMDVATAHGIDADDAALTTYAAWAKENGVPQAAFDDLIGRIGKAQGDAEVQAKTDDAAEKAKLGANADEMIGGVKTWLEGLHAKGILDDESLNALVSAGAKADGVRALLRLRAASGDAGIPTDIDITEVDKGVPTKEEIASAMADPKWDEQDPAHVKKVNDMVARRAKAQEAAAKKS